MPEIAPASGVATPPPPPPAPPPPHRKLKSALLWAARQLLPGGGFHTGDITVSISSHVQAESSVVMPSVDADGLQEPSGVTLKRKLAEGGPDPAILRRHFLSYKERAILRALSELAPCKAQTVFDRVRGEVGKADFWALWSNLQHRALVEQSVAGFQVAAEWVVALLSAG